MSHSPWRVWWSQPPRVPLNSGNKLAKRRNVAFRVNVEELEPRLTPATFAVNAQLAVHQLDSFGDGPGPTRAVVFFESSVADYQILRHGLEAGTDAVLLDSSGDGLAEMATFLGHYHDLASIGVVAHGAPAAMFLGTATLDLQSLGKHRNELRAMGSALAPGGELDLWSCDIGAGQAGASLLDNVALATGAGVAATGHKIGASALGGDWQLDVRTAGALGNVPFSTSAILAFPDVLGLTIAPSNNNGKGYVGLNYNQSGHSIPPDTNGAAGPTSYVETVNQTIAIYTPKATGTSKVSVALDTFFSSLAPVTS